jgi:hypothetical protein
MQTSASSNSSLAGLDRALAACGLASVVLVLAGVATAGGSPLITDSVAKTTDYFSSGTGAADWIGQGVEILGILLIVPFVAAVAAVIRRAGSVGADALGLTAFGGGLLYAGLSLSPGVAALMAGWYRAEHGFSGQTAVALNDLRDMTFYLSMAVLGVFVAAAAAAVLRLGIAPRWIGWTGAPIAVGLLAVPAIPPAALLGLVWMAVFSIALARGARSRASATAGEPAMATRH